MSSLGYALTNWTSEFIRHQKKHKKYKKNKVNNKNINAISIATTTQTEGKIDLFFVNNTCLNV